MLINLSTNCKLKPKNLRYYMHRREFPDGNTLLQLLSPLRRRKGSKLTNIAVNTFGKLSSLLTSISDQSKRKAVLPRMFTLDK